MSPSEIEARARDKFGEPNRRLSSRHDLRFGRKGSVSVRLTGERAGAWFDHEARQGGTLLTSADTGYERPLSRERPRHHSESLPQLKRALRNLCPASGSPAALYLRRRGITDWPPHCIRHCRAPFGMAALAQDGAGNVRALQIVYLTDDGQKRRDLGVVKRTYTAMERWHEIAAVRMPGRGVPILCEGPETGLSIWIATRRPVHVCLGAGGLRELRLRSRRIVVARDGDAPDSPADRFLRNSIDRRRELGQDVKVATPPPGEDFNDVLLRAGPDEVARLIREAA